VIAFGGRVIGRGARAEVPELAREPDLPQGRRAVRARWSRGAIRKAETALVVEGYMDYVSLASHGVENVVAPLGTAMTPSSRRS
jgi:DNA primase